MAKNTRNFPRSNEEELKDTIRKLKAERRKLYKKLDKLQTQNKTLEQAWNDTLKLLQIMETKSLEECIEEAKKFKGEIKDE